MLFVIWYRPPSAPAIVFTDQLDKIIASATKTYKKVCILDDFNMYIGVTVLHLKNRAQHIFCVYYAKCVWLGSVNTMPPAKHSNILDLVILNTAHRRM